MPDDAGWYNAVQALTKTNAKLRSALSAIIEETALYDWAGQKGISSAEYDRRKAIIAEALEAINWNGDKRA